MTRTPLGRRPARAALDACAFAPPAVDPHFGVRWRAESDEVLVASWELPPERPEVRVRIGPDRAVRAVSAERWDREATPDFREATPDFRYIPCGGDILAERRFGDFTVPSRAEVSWCPARRAARRSSGCSCATSFRVQLRDFAPVA